MGKKAGSKIDGVQGQKEVDGIFFSVEVVTVWIDPGFGCFINRKRGSIRGDAAVINSDSRCPICDPAAASANAIKYMV
jgi:hypothetical protein